LAGEHSRAKALALQTRARRAIIIKVKFTNASFAPLEKGPSWKARLLGSPVFSDISRAWRISSGDISDTALPLGMVDPTRNHGAGFYAPCWYGYEVTLVTSLN
jgi:hypothetical protein